MQNHEYSTTRLLTTERPQVEENENGLYKTYLFLPKNSDRKGEGGLRSKGYFKRSHLDKPLIAVITVVFNGAKYLEQTILSVIHQTYDNVEYVIIDGASTDGTLDIIRKYEHAIDYWVSEKDEGIYDAMNKGLQAIASDYLLMLGCDDLFYNNSVLTNFAKHKKTPNAIVYGDVFFMRDKKLYGGKFSKLTLTFKNLSHQAILYPYTVYKKYKYDLGYKYFSDYEYNIRLWGAGVIFQRIDLVIAMYNQTGVSSFNQDKCFLKQKPLIIYKNFGLIYWLASILQKIKLKFIGKRLSF